MRLLAYNGLAFEDLGLGAGFTRDGEPGPDVRALTLNRRGYLPVHVGLEVGVKILTAQFVVKPTVAIEPILLNALGMWNPRDETERLLEGELNDGTPVQAFAALGTYRFTTVNQLQLDFSLTDPTWWRATPTSVGPVSWPTATAATLAVPNNGKALSNLLVTLKPTAAAAGAEFRWRRQVTITNNSDMPLRRHPVELALGDTSTWSGPPTPGHVFIFLDGLEVPALFAAGVGQAGPGYAWIIVSELAPGASLTYDLCWNGTATAQTLSGVNLPAFDTSSYRGTASSGAVNRLYVSGTPWGVDQFTGGEVTLTAGPGAGQTRAVTLSTANMLAISPNWATVPTSSSSFIVRQSSNTAWNYRVRQSEHAGAGDRRGLWYLNRGQSKPSMAVFDVPGGWYRLLRYDNRDEKNQSRWVGIVPEGGSTDADYYALLDADRTAQGWKKLPEEGQGDSVGFSSPVPITGWRFDWTFRNPNGIARAQFGARESGAEDWELFIDSADIYQSLTLQPPNDQTFTGDMRHLIATLAPSNEEEIPVSFIRDQGSRSGGGSSTLFDDSKEWQTNQWVGATIRIVAGTGAGQARTVTSNDSVHVAVSPDWATTPSDDSRYELTNKVLLATLRCATTWQVRLSGSAISVSAVGAEQALFVQKRSLILAPTDSLALPYQELRVGLDGRRVFLVTGQELRIDGPRRRAGIYVTASNTFVKDVTSGLLVRNRDVTNTAYYAPDWLPVVPQNPDLGPATLYLTAQPTDGTVEVSAQLVEGYYG